MEAVHEAFRGFVANVRPGGTLVLCADSPEAMELRPFAPAGVGVETYSLRHDLRLPSRASPRAGWFARMIRDEGDVGANSGSRPSSQRFEVLRYGQHFGEFSTALSGTPQRRKRPRRNRRVHRRRPLGARR